MDLLSTDDLLELHAILRKYSEDQPRDENGRFAGGAEAALDRVEGAEAHDTDWKPDESEASRAISGIYEGTSNLYSHALPTGPMERGAQPNTGDVIRYPDSPRGTHAAFVVYRGPEGNPVGYVMMVEPNKGEPGGRTIEEVVISPSERGKGLGSAMYDWVQDNTDINLYDSIGQSQSFTTEGKAFAQAWLEHRIQLEGGTVSKMERTALQQAREALARVRRAPVSPSGMPSPEETIAKLTKSNPYHEPAGSPEGGQFASADGGYGEMTGSGFRYLDQNTEPDKMFWDNRVSERFPFEGSASLRDTFGPAELTTQEQRGVLKREVATDVGSRIDSQLTREQILATPLGQNIAAGTYLFGDDSHGNQNTAGMAVAATLHDSWANTSGDHTVEALAVQVAAAKEFGLPGAANPVEVYGITPDVTRTSVDDYYKANEPVLRAYARAEYENTQAFLKESGVTELTLYRGVILSEPIKAGESVQTNPLSSWTTNLQTAAFFAEPDNPVAGSQVLAATVPASRVFSTSFSGAGCLSEYEAILLGGTDSPTVYSLQTAEQIK